MRVKLRELNPGLFAKRKNHQRQKFQAWHSNSIKNIYTATRVSLWSNIRRKQSAKQPVLESDLLEVQRASKNFRGLYGGSCLLAENSRIIEKTHITRAVGMFQKEVRCSSLIFIPYITLLIYFSHTQLTWDFHANLRMVEFYILNY